MPDDCGSTSVSIICTAMAASSAEPPRRRMVTPASTARGLAAATMSRFANCVDLGVQPDGNSGWLAVWADTCVAGPRSVASTTARARGVMRIRE